MLNTITRQLSIGAQQPTSRDQQEEQDPLEGTSKEEEVGDHPEVGDQPEFVVIDEIGEESSQPDTSEISDIEDPTSDVLNTTQESIDWGDFKRKKALRRQNSN